MTDAAIVMGSQRAETFRGQKKYPVAVGEHLVPSPAEKVAPFAGGVEAGPPAGGTVLGGMFSQFIPEWTKRRKAWIERGAPAAAVTNEKQVILPQQVGFGFGIIEAVTKGPILSRLREIIGGK